MNNANGSPQRPPLPPLTSLVKPEQILAFPNFPESQRQKYHEGVIKLWNTIENGSPASKEYQQAYSKLVDVTVNIRRTVTKSKADMQAQATAAAVAHQNGARPLSSGQAMTQEARPQTQQSQSGGQLQGQEVWSQKVVENVKQLHIIAPPGSTTTANTEQAQRWVREAQHKYASHLHKFEVTTTRLKQLHNAADSRNSQGHPLNERETENYRSQQASMEQTQREIRDWINKFQKQQEAFKLQLQGQAVANGSATSTQPSGNTSQPMKREPSDGAGVQAQRSQANQNQPHTINSAVDAARNQGTAAVNSTMSPQNPGQSAQHSMNHSQNSRPQPSEVPPPQNSGQTINVNNSQISGQPHNSPRLAPSKSSLAMPNEPSPPSLQAAIEHARSYTQPNPNHPTPHSTTHGHPAGDQRNQTNHAKMPIPKDLNLQPTQPVAMGPSRPTLSNGPVPLGPMGQPAIQRHPGYVLEGEGERVMSKKKLEELVRQVTGGTGGEGEEGEVLTADVEETLLQVADDFVDQVIVAACRLAKLRQSSTLELRDLQLILERNYNIRVPGYASDELRTVKKIVPTPGWTQKLSAVQAAKVTGGKGDL